MFNIPSEPMRLSPADPIEQFGKYMALKNLMQNAPLQNQALQQQVQQGQMQTQMMQQQQKDQQAMTAAMQEWDGKDYNSLPGLVMKHGASAQAVMGLKTNIIKQQQDISNLTKDQLANQKVQNDYFAQSIANIKALPPEQQAQGFEAAKADAVQKGYLKPDAAQQMQYQGPQQLDLLEKSLLGHAGAVEMALKNAQTTEAANRANESQSIADKTQMETDAMKQFGGISPQMVESKYLFLQTKKNQGFPISPQDEAWMKSYEQNKLMVPKASATIRMEGMGQTREYPVYDTKTGTTLMLSANEINRANLQERGRYTVPGYTPEAVIQKKTAESVAPGGKVGEEVNAFQTAIQHADLLKQAATALQNGDQRTLNKIKNTWKNEFGSPLPVSAQLIANAYTREVTKALTGNHITDNEIRENGATIDVNKASFSQIAAAADSYKALMQSKMNVRQQQYEAGKQGKPNFGQQQNNGGSNNQGAVISVQAPNGKTYTFPNQAAADAFKQKAGIK